MVRWLVVTELCLFQLWWFLATANIKTVTQRWANWNDVHSAATVSRLSNNWPFEVAISYESRWNSASARWHVLGSAWSEQLSACLPSLSAKFCLLCRLQYCFVNIRWWEFWVPIWTKAVDHLQRMSLQMTTCYNVYSKLYELYITVILNCTLP